VYVGSQECQGVLFLDELLEFGQHGLEVLRQPLDPAGKSDERRGEPSAAIRARVEAARARQTGRFAVGAGVRSGPTTARGGGKSAPTLTCNADTPALALRATAGASVGPTQVCDYCQVDETARQLLATATPALAPERSAGASVRQMQFSARAYHRILKLARPIADLAGSERIQTAHVAKAIQYRSRRQE